jgi:hypothetical protein
MYNIGINCKETFVFDYIFKLGLNVEDWKLKLRNSLWKMINLLLKKCIIGENRLSR